MAEARRPPSGPHEVLTEPQEVLTESEERFERARRTLGLFLGPAVAIVVALLPLPVLSPEAHRLAAVLAFVVVSWVTEAVPLPVTAVLGPALCVVVGVAGAKEVFAPFAHPIVFLLIGSFLLAAAMSEHGLARRLAFGVLSLRLVGRSPARILFAIGGVAAVVSMWISNTAATAMVFPIALGILQVLDPKGQDRRYATALMLIVAYAASVGGLGTLIGTPPNLIGVGMIEAQTGVRITFVTWLGLGLPIMVVSFLILYGLLAGLHQPWPRLAEGFAAYVAAERRALGAWSRGEKNAAAAFGIAVGLWLMPGVLAALDGPQGPLTAWYEAHLPETIVAPLAASLLFILPTDWARRQFTLTWRQAHAIDWGTILLFGGGLSLGALMEKTGLAAAIGQGLVDLFAVTSVWGITALAIGIAILISEAASNTASATMVIPVVMAIAQAAGVSPIPPALGACLGASFGFMMPISTPPNAIVYGSGLIPITRMIRAGLLLDVVGFAVIWAGLRLLCPLLGLV